MTHTIQNLDTSLNQSQNQLQEQIQKQSPALTSKKASSSKTEIQQQALKNAINNDSIANYEAIIKGFMALGIEKDAITPRKNVFN